MNLVFPDFYLVPIAVQPVSEKSGCGFSLVRLPQSALPDRCDSPPRRDKSGAKSGVAGPVGFQLGQPEVRARRRRSGVTALLVAVPEATVDEYDGSVHGQHNIGPARDTLRVQPESETTRMQ